MQDFSEEDKLIESIKNEKDIMNKVRLLTQLTKTREVKVKDIAQKLGVKSSYVCHLLRLNRLPEAIIDGYYSGNITLSHLFVISRLKDANQMIGAYEKVLADSLTVKSTEEVVRDILYGIKTEGDYISPQEKENFIQQITSLKKNLNLKIIQTRIKSKIILEIRGNLEKTSKEVRDLMKRFEMW
ncbi:hypothetical protein A3C98_03475 [Candidatus Roizmanbacteria bacterium RIFCSPHIGHO2_02_FULL_37_15]|uniref:ParB/Spo0J HTH domain-containing protein n=1 Tax=Candidatus Roizmanbacteria bacterium RIFCSPLOWO2_01_FULL_37_16 TaxID=1802058 RepID=A0A1F7IIU5_9BACT|nr:MAG: hypothetical protein A2859_05250 [Candidatus Roizmanbacteria bacterium RIFCSPHIGHO2_01_FULL_37_16b]OGK20434.1 MAG: hypothetical protein A3C98_03475 [Candidatus Roizmanbacteria bacterium RIFCSPHIGHO2_02_FULL_37_15]OGK34035.1 MAG: hypothetical protein A3F57_02425 [Candidatus Roizmanbacteria bacterium RIFCSPHIGHO2_12_FULL_36_11]OGK43285.1 MAG: hypothetical protein A3B40_02220 [Candidatus Roizmanbacteria bacterium RIFCSPLOWO2_01_FULL_37_16]OGK57672.1 MAG: hypothetical protein A3I50_00040 [C